jgi:hypothetical protein
VYVLFGNIGVFAFTMDGTPVWQRTWPARATRYDWGTAAGTHQMMRQVVQNQVLEWTVAASRLLLYARTSIPSNS